MGIKGKIYFYGTGAGGPKSSGSKNHE